VLDLRQANPRRQGDIGEAAAIAWLTQVGFGVWVSLGHSPDVGLITQKGDRLATKGGNRSWSGRVKTIDPGRFEYLFVLVADGRQWFIPAAAIKAKTMLLLGGPKYADFEIDARPGDRMGERGFEPL
jgi:hypothetical protein